MNAANLVLLLGLLARSPAAAPVSMTTVLRQAIETKKAETHWTEWQKRLIETEVLSSAASYIQDVDMSRDGIRAKVDWELLTRYLTHWGPQYWQKKRPLLLVDVEVSASCGSLCRSKEESLTESLSRRMARRGYLPVEKPHAQQVGSFMVHLTQQKKQGVRLIEMEARWKWLGTTERHKVLQQGTEESVTDLFQRLMFEVWTQKIQDRDFSPAPERGPSSQEEWGMLAVGLRHYSEIASIRDGLAKALVCEDLTMRGFLGHKAFFVCKSKGEGALRHLAADVLKHGLIFPSEGRSKVIHLELRTGDKWYK